MHLFLHMPRDKLNDPAGNISGMARSMYASRASAYAHLLK